MANLTIGQGIVFNPDRFNFEWAWKKEPPQGQGTATANLTGANHEELRVFVHLHNHVVERETIIPENLNAEAHQQRGVTFTVVADPANPLLILANVDVELHFSYYAQARVIVADNTTAFASFSASWGDRDAPQLADPGLNPPAPLAPRVVRGPDATVSASRQTQGEDQDTGHVDNYVAKITRVPVRVGGVYTVGVQASASCRFDGVARTWSNAREGDYKMTLHKIQVRF